MTMLFNWKYENISFTDNLFCYVMLWYPWTFVIVKSNLNNPDPWGLGWVGLRSFQTQVDQSLDWSIDDILEDYAVSWRAWQLTLTTSVAWNLNRSTCALSYLMFPLQLVSNNRKHQVVYLNTIQASQKSSTWQQNLWKP